jgi:hypothetical protein
MLKGCMLGTGGGWMSPGTNRSNLCPMDIYTHGGDRQVLSLCTTVYTHDTLTMQVSTCPMCTLTVHYTHYALYSCKSGKSAYCWYNGHLPLWDPSNNVDIVRRYYTAGNRLPSYSVLILYSYSVLILYSYCTLILYSHTVLSYCPVILYSYCPLILYSHTVLSYCTLILYSCPLVLYSYCPHTSGNRLP